MQTLGAMVTNIKNNNPKELFLNDYKEATRASYKRVLDKAERLEEVLGRDLYTFSMTEVGDVLKTDLKASTPQAVESYGRIISKYMYWAIENNLRAEVNPLADMKPRDFAKYVGDSTRSYFSEKQLRRYEDRSANYQDIVILRLIFEGIGGKEASEIRYLTKDDVKEDGTLSLKEVVKTDSKGNPIEYVKRTVQVEQRTIDLIKGAVESTIYYKKNGRMVEVDNVRNYTDLVSNDYVVRNSITKTDNLSQAVGKILVYRRVKIIADSFGLSNFTTKTIERSGMIYMVYKMLKEDGRDKLTNEDYKAVAKRFKIGTWQSLKSFITIENIESIYGSINE